MCRVKFIWVRIALFFAGIALFAGFRFFGPSQTISSAPARKAVVVELFTSEGCSSCPPADALLAQLGKSSGPVTVIPLGFHVDYWNFQGWTDRFSSASYTKRQEKYADQLRIPSTYTPQMVVDGATELVGSDVSRAHQVIGRAATEPATATVDVSLSGTDKLAVNVQDTSRQSSDVLLAITEDNLSSEVKAGENGGHVLRHAAVVRDLRVLGSIHDGRFTATLPLKLDKKWKLADLHAAVFVQSATGRIEGAATIQLASLAAAR